MQQLTNTDTVVEQSSEARALSHRNAALARQTPARQHTVSRSVPIRRRVGAILGVAASAMGLVTVAANIAAAEPIEPPPWSLCAYADHPAAADLGPLIPTNVNPSAEVKAVLLGKTPVGTDCSFYDLPV